ncbi:hypothetical protein Thimo_3345 [Thioflavicoccus mobilis 8321]|uniref:DUF2007 domain-containing protein n=1 Tax=Thioflavicoccus mobilis 8321 TaxID=765912 RepID=L0H1V7_9GAMM|nr:DUF2007 domain-containing protein [Thioflavicoccus mobilis]AGA92017.1 hypothetical protein Thimo_3345 [Thioflavicoccus mobilis 8321]
MQRLYVARDRIEAQLLADLLERHRIRAEIFGDYLAGAAGELPANIWPTVWVLDDADLARAGTLLAQFLADAARPPGEAWVCPGCGERLDGSFELCWRCGRPRE